MSMLSRWNHKPILHTRVPSSAAKAGDHHAEPGEERALLRDASRVFLAGLFVLLVLSAAIADAAELDGRFAPAAVVLYGAITVISLAGLHYHPHRRFGAPNVITTVRAVATALFAGLVIDAERLEPGPFELWAWVFAAIALFALALDGIDGYLARRMNICSAYGARYDMEVDALLILLLSVLALALGKAGPYVLAIGLMRYAFVAAQFVLPWLSRPLPPSIRRKAVCVLQAGALGVMITPVLQPPFSEWLAAVTLAFLVWSFALDVAWLHRHRRDAS